VCCDNSTKLELSSVRVIGSSDASFAGSHDSSSHFGYLVFIADANENLIPIYFKSYKARRVTRSVMGAELITFSDMFDVAYTLGEELRQVIPAAAVPLHLFTDSKSLFDLRCYFEGEQDFREATDVRHRLHP